MSTRHGMTVEVGEGGRNWLLWIDRVLAGETVVIFRAGHPLVELKPLIEKPGRELGAARRDPVEWVSRGSGVDVERLIGGKGNSEE